MLFRLKFLLEVVRFLLTTGKELAVELAKNGKTLVGYVLLEFPELSGYPGLVGVLEEFASNPSKENAFKVAVQVILAIGAGHRAIKILKAVLGRILELRK